MATSIRTTLYAAFALLWPLAAASAQIPLGSEFRVDTGGAAYGFMLGNPRFVSMVPDGRFVVAWTTLGTGAGAYDIAARRFDAVGVPIGTGFLVNSFTNGWQYNESVATDEAGNFVVVWHSTPPSSSFTVLGQRFDASGAPRGSEFRVSDVVDSARNPSVAMAPDGAFVVVWWSGTNGGVWARRYDSAGTPAGGPFQVNTSIESAVNPSVAVDGGGNFVVVWESGFPSSDVRGRLFTSGGLPLGPEFLVDGPFSGTRSRVARSPDGAFVVAWMRMGYTVAIAVRRFDAAGNPLGPEFAVNENTTGIKRDPDLALDADGDFIVTWQSEFQDGSGREIFARRFEGATFAGPEFRVNTYTTGGQVFPSVSSDPAGNFVVAWHSNQNGVSGVFAQRYAGGLMGTALTVDASAGATSDGNRVLEAGETVAVAPTWLNANATAQTFTGAASSFTGPGTPGNPTYSITDATASYGTVASGATATCAVTPDCYAVGITVPATRPVVHWDASFREEIAPANLGAAENWVLHVGDSFSDVPRSSPFYRFVETILHRRVTGGCTTTAYCPTAPVSREQMSVFVLQSKEGGGYAPAACTTPLFDDVPANSPFCRYVEELARRGVVAGCGPDLYCPFDAVTREQIAVFVLATLQPGVVPPACGATPMFADVPASSPFCRYIEDLARRGVVTGCGDGAYCPAAPVTREQMSVFLTVTFGLRLYGP